MRIYNSLTRRKEEFIPLESRKVMMYTCGVTVYDDCHIGHARSLFIFEVIRNYLKYKDFDVKFVRNITDVDDKIIDKARNWSTEKKISLKEALDLVRETYINSYYRDLKALNLPSADKEPKATENIADMDEFIRKLIDKGFAYEADGNVYFSVRQFSAYGKLSGKKIDELMSSVRIEPDPLKKDSLDFALWKKKKQDEPSWPSGISEGRPGWHIECSVMAQKFLGETLDIHGGGGDLIFPHHENEIAQSEALTGKPFAKYWIHHGLLTTDGQKMAKSLGNFVTIKSFMERYAHPNILKFFFLSTHYRYPIDYTEEKIEESRRINERLFIMLKKVRDIFSRLTTEQKRKMEEGTAEDKKLEYRRHFENAMDDDFNMPLALTALQKLITDTNIIIADYPQLTYKDMSLRQLYYACYILLPEIAEVFSIDLNALPQTGGYLDKEIETLINERNKARKNKNFKPADQIRKELEDKGIILEDTGDGRTTWRRKL